MEDIFFLLNEVSRKIWTESFTGRKKTYGGGQVKASSSSCSAKGQKAARRK